MALRIFEQQAKAIGRVFSIAANFRQRASHTEDLSLVCSAIFACLLERFGAEKLDWSTLEVSPTPRDSCTRKKRFDLHCKTNTNNKKRLWPCSDREFRPSA